MQVVKATPGFRVVDSLPYSMGGTAAQAEALYRAGVEGLIGYLGYITPERLSFVLNAGLLFSPVTTAGEYKDGAADEVTRLLALGIPKSADVFLDLEGMDAWNTDPKVLSKLINEWAATIEKGGWVPKLYVGAPQPLTGAELFALGVRGYWLGQGRCIDRFGKDAYPNCGWQIRQDWHNNPVPGRAGGMNWKNTGVFVDTNAIQADHFGRLPAMVGL